MKKTLFSVFFFFALFFFPLSVLGAAMEITVTITSVKSPERSAMVLKTDRPNTEFAFPQGSGRITVIRNSNSFVEALAPVAGYVRKDSFATFTMAYGAALAPYNVYLEIQAVAQGSNVICKADCSSVPANSGWYYISPFYTSPDLCGYYCPVPPCNNTYKGAIALNSAYVVGGYWRSPYWAG